MRNVLQGMRKRVPNKYLCIKQGYNKPSLNDYMRKYRSHESEEEANFLDSVVQCKHPLFLTPEEYQRLANNSNRESIHLEDFPKPLEECYRQAHVKILIETILQSFP